MAAPRKAAEPKPGRPQPRVIERNSVLVIVWPVYRWRVLLSDGRVLDVEGTHDGSELRGVLLAHVGKPADDLRIVGISDGEHVRWAEPIDDDT